MDSIPDEVLELILLRLDSPISVIHAASTSKRWRRIIAAAGFLRRFASVQGQPHRLVAGSYYNSVFSVVPQLFVAAYQSPLVDSNRFCLDFLQSDHDRVCPFHPLTWTIRDSRGSLLLLAYNEYDLHKPRLHMIVCEPLTRRRRRITFSLVNGWSIHTGPFFLDASADDSAGFSDFGLVCVLFHVASHSYRVAVFSSSACEHGSWKSTSVDWKSMYFLGKTKSLYWHVGDRIVAAMDRRTALFSTSKLPRCSEDWDRQRLVVVACRDDEPRIIVTGIRESGFLKLFARSQDGSEWALEKTIQLSNVLPGCDPSYFSTRLGWVQVTAVDMAMVVVECQSWAYRLDINTMEVERVMNNAYRQVAFPSELPWPPAFLACTDLV